MASSDGIVAVEMEPLNVAATNGTATETPPPSPPTTPPPAQINTTTTTTTTATITIQNSSNHKKPSTTLDELEDAHYSVTAAAAAASANTNSILPALPGTSSSASARLYHEAAAAHGGTDSTNFLTHESANTTASQSRLRSASSTLDASVSRNPSTTGKHEKKIGHRRVDEGGEVTYKKIQSKQIMGSIQLGIQHTVGSLASKPKRDLLMNDFWEMETISFPPDGSSITPAHHYSDFRFKVYAPIAFRYFRDLFGIEPDDFLMSMCASPLLELSNPGASGSIFYLTDDDEFIIKTVQKKECEFLQKLLPGYYMNLSQNPRTLLPKFFGLYCFHYNSKNVRLVAMNNLLPSEIKMHSKYDLKGSTFRRKASKAERQKASPTFKDLDFMEHHPNGIFLETDKYNALIKTIQRDCMVLESFQIMDYSLLVGIHNLDIAQKEKREERIRNARAKLQRHDDSNLDDSLESEQVPISVYNPAAAAAAVVATSSAAALAAGLSAAAGTALNRSRSMNRQRLVAHSTAMESITADMDAPLEEDEDVPAGGIPARSENDERLILYIGIIDILQSYRLEKKLEHTFKSIIYNGDTVSVCRPSFYAQRFQNFMGKTVFKKTPTFPLKHSPSKRKTSTVAMMRTPQRTPSQSLTSQVRPTLMSGSSTPPPAFDDISEEDLTATSSTGGGGGGSAHMSGLLRLSTPPQSQTHSQSTSRRLNTQRSYVSSNRSVISNATDDYSDEDYDVSSAPISSPHTRSPRLSKTNVQLTSIGCIEDDVRKSPVVIDNDNADDDESESEPSSRLLDANGKVSNNAVSGAKTTTTVIKSVQQAQTYTTTLVVNDVAR